MGEEHMTVSGEQVAELGVCLARFFSKRRVHPVVAYLAMSIMVEELAARFDIEISDTWDSSSYRDN